MVLHRVPLRLRVLTDAVQAQLEELDLKGILGYRPVLHLGWEKIGSLAQFPHRRVSSRAGFGEHVVDHLERGRMCTCVCVWIFL